MRLSARDLCELTFGHGEILDHDVGPNVAQPKPRQQGLDLAPVVSTRGKTAANSPEQDVL